MPKLITILIIIQISATALATSVRQCCEDPNAEWTECGSACPPTCQKSRPEVCITLCVQGCACKPGFILSHKGGLCIPNGTCKGQCRKSEVFNPCGTRCPATCDDPAPACVKICNEGCFCKPGWVLNNAEDQVCIPKEKCPPKCGPNKVQGCVNPCPPTCQVPSPTPCPTLRCEPGCVCAPGFVLENFNSTKCVPVKECRKLCGDHECFNDCGTACPSTCNAKNRPCTLQCQPGCFCDEGYILSSEQGGCIKEGSCPK